jgi:hypothetical protein
MKDPRLDPELVAAKMATTKMAVNSKALFVARSNFGAVATILPDLSTGPSEEVQLDNSGNHVLVDLLTLCGPSSLEP